MYKCHICLYIYIFIYISCNSCSINGRVLLPYVRSCCEVAKEAVFDDDDDDDAADINELSISLIVIKESIAF